MPLICIDCVKDWSLKKLISSSGIDGTECDVCHGPSKAIDADSNAFRQLFKALIRYHYNEWEYNTHWGGEPLENIFQSENPILEWNIQRDEDGFSMVYEAAIINVYEDYDKGVSIFAGYMEDGSPAGILRSLKSETHLDLERIAKRLDSENYYNVENEMRQLLERYKGIFNIQVPSGIEFFRARVGCKNKNIPSVGFFDSDFHYQPFTDTEISALPPGTSGPGRLNRAGISFFYAATNYETAIAEVRPHPGDIVSIGLFRTTRDLLIADFAETQIEQFSDSDRLLDEFLLLNAINTYLNKLVSPSDRRHYSVTQLIAESIRQLGYEGILFRSTVGKGKNFVLFHPELVEYRKNSGQVFEIQKLEYSISEKKLLKVTENHREDH